MPSTFKYVMYLKIPGGKKHLPLFEQKNNKPESSMGSLSTDLRTWSDSPVRELSSIFRSFPWTKIPSAGSRSPEHRHTHISVLLSLLALYILTITAQHQLNSLDFNCFLCHFPLSLSLFFSLQIVSPSMHACKWRDINSTTNTRRNNKCMEWMVFLIICVCLLVSVVTVAGSLTNEKCLT